MTTEVQWVMLCVLFWVMGGLAGFFVAELRHLRHLNRLTDTLIQRSQRTLNTFFQGDGHG